MQRLHSFHTGRGRRFSRGAQTVMRVQRRGRGAVIWVISLRVRSAEHSGSTECLPLHQLWDHPKVPLIRCSVAYWSVTGFTTFFLQHYFRKLMKLQRDKGVLSSSKKKTWFTHPTITLRRLPVYFTWAIISWGTFVPTFTIKAKFAILFL